MNKNVHDTRWNTECLNCRDFQNFQRSLEDVNLLLKFNEKRIEQKS